MVLCFPYMYLRIFALIFMNPLSLQGPWVNFNGYIWDFPGGSDGKVSAYNAEDPGSIPVLGRSSGEGNGNPLQYPYLEIPMDRGAW